VADIIVASLLVDSTAVPRKVARLHLICDILHNSAASVPSAWKFRMEFQSRLGIVFDHLGNIYHSFPGRITADTFKKQILSVVEVWEDWIVFPPDFTAELRERLEGPLKEERQEHDDDQVDRADSQMQSNKFTSRFNSSSFQPAAPDTVPTATSVGEDAMDLESDAEDDLDGEPVADDMDGELMGDDIDGEPIGDDIDGEPVTDDIDGEPIDDVDGLPIEEDVGQPIA
jgi:U2-associated protein SR140